MLCLCFSDFTLKFVDVESKEQKLFMLCLCFSDFTMKFVDVESTEQKCLCCVCVSVTLQ